MKSLQLILLRQCIAILPLRPTFRPHFLLMRVVPFLISTVVTVGLVFALNRRWGSVPDLGNFLSPQTGFWQAAEGSNDDLNEDFAFPNLKGKVSVYLDDRLVPHVFAQHDEDAYFVQGFLHAKYRLWQMDFQTRYAAGRLSEVVNNPALLNVDKMQRRMGMVHGAEQMVKAMEADPQTKPVVDAYTAGVNAYINNLTQSKLPLEYKLLGYKPEPWSNLKVALFIKLMSADLAGFGTERDIEFTNEKEVFSNAEMALLYPQFSDSSQPIIPKGTAFEPATITPVAPATADSLYYGNDTVINPVQVPKIVDIKGSNNWAVSGSKTASGSPILCNDPHLGLTLPSIWYEMQLHTPTMNAYGATFPSIPGVVIGFNENIAFGFTNAGRDVMDYFRIRFKDASRKEYWYNGAWKAAEMKVEEIKRLGQPSVMDTVAYTVFGPAIYDRTFNNGDSTIRGAVALRWTAHEPSNELLMWVKLNRATDYAGYADAIKSFQTPGQNMLFASKTGDIAIWQQGRFPARWKGQGLYLMPGEDESYNWQGWIPQEHNPHSTNPAQGFLQSANQMPVDSTYPYFIPGDYFTPRGVTAHRKLSAMQSITVDDMKRLQTDNSSSIATDALPFLLRFVNEAYLTSEEKNYLDTLRGWDNIYSANAVAPTIYQAWFDSLQKQIWSDEFAQVKGPTATPDEQDLFEMLKRDSAMRFVDDIRTPQVETLAQQATTAFKLAASALANQADRIWWKQKDSRIQHLLRDALKPFGRYHLVSGGWRTALNAHSQTHGPSWRMIVHLTAETEAWGIYPAGQSGNPGSRYYDNFVDDWVSGRYYRLWMMKESEKGDKKVVGTLNFSQG